MNQHTGLIPVEEVHRWKSEATQRLLGYTIGLGDEDWRQPTPLPGWSRAHVATHLARNADFLRSVMEATDGGRPQPIAPTAADRVAALEFGADRSGLELQIDLDTTAGALQQAIDKVTDWTLPITLHGATRQLSSLTLSRLHEVCVHHLDLDPAFTPDAIDPAAAAWLLRWVLDLLVDTDLPALRLDGDSLIAELGSADTHRAVSGSDARLWAWLSGRGPAGSVTGADGLQPGLLT